MNKKYTKYNYTNGKKHTVEMDTNEKKVYETELSE